MHWVFALQNLHPSLSPEDEYPLRKTETIVLGQPLAKVAGFLCKNTEKQLTLL